MKFSYTTLLDYPLADSLEHIKTADENGYYACYAADETWHKDLWLLYAAAADKTKNVRFGPNLSSVYLREPTLICQALATLDELTGGRAEGVISCGNFGMLAQYGVDWKTIKPFSRVKEAHEIMRTFLDDGVITYDGQFHRYAGLFTFARPVQERLPLYIGAMRGPKSMQLAGEVSDGVHSALGYNKAWFDYVVENVKIGADKRRARLEDARHRRLVRRHLRARLGEGQVGGAGHRHLLPLGPARRAVRGARDRPGGDEGDRRGARHRRPREGVRDDHARDRRQAVDRRHPGGVRGEDQGDGVGGGQPHDPLRHRPVHPQALRPARGRRPGRQRTAQAHRRRGRCRSSPELRRKGPSRIKPPITRPMPAQCTQRGRSCRSTTPKTIGTTEYGAAAVATTVVSACRTPKLKATYPRVSTTAISEIVARSRGERSGKRHSPPRSDTATRKSVENPRARKIGTSHP